MTCSIPNQYIYDKNNDFKEYEAFIYSMFVKSFNIINEHFKYKNKPLKFRREPIFEGKEEVFWHITSTSEAGKRTKDYARYSKIDWPRHVLFDCFLNDNNCNFAWVRNRTNRIHIWCTEINYLVVLEERKDYVLFITAYPVVWEHNKNKLLQEYNNTPIDNIIK